MQLTLLPYSPDFEALRDDPDFISLTRPKSPGGPEPKGATTAHSANYRFGSRAHQIELVQVGRIGRLYAAVCAIDHE